MKRVLKIYDTAILNFADLQKEFAPWELYKNLSEFQAFAKVHCVPLPLRLVHGGENTNYRAEYLDKIFWENILKKEMWERPESAETCLKEVLNQMFIEKAGVRNDDGELIYSKDADGIKAQIEVEYRDAKLDEKLPHIVESAGLTVSPDCGKIAVKLLAICELAEKDAAKLDFQNGAEEYVTMEGNGVISDFPEVDDISLTAGKRIYRYWKYEKKELAEDKKIKTVCVAAKAAKSPNQVVIIELYNQSDRSLSESIVIAAGTFRYCNVAEGKIIKFLPLESAGDTLTLTLKNQAHPELIVTPDGVEPWKLDAKDISGFSSETKEQGFLFIKNGKVNRAFYKTVNAYMTEIRMAMILTPLVEVRIKNGRYELLTEDGQILSDGPRDGMRGCVDLDRVEGGDGKK